MSDILSSLDRWQLVSKTYNVMEIYPVYVFMEGVDAVMVRDLTHRLNSYLPYYNAVIPRVRMFANMERTDNDIIKEMMIYWNERDYVSGCKSTSLSRP